MKALVFDKFGDPASVLRIADLPQPVPKRGEVLVRMIASPVNPSDILFIRGQYGVKPTAWPATPGFEGVGVVEASGGGLLGRLRKGKRVAVLSSGHGNWAEYTVTSARQVIPVPSDLPDDQAAGFFVNPATAVALTRHVLNVPAGEWLLQSAAGSSLGKMVIALGRKHGFRTINTVRRPEQVAELKTLGADEVLLEAGDPLDERIRVATGGGVKYAIDPVGGTTGTAVVKSLAAEGRCIHFGALSGEPITVDPRFLITGQKRLEGFWLGDWAKAHGILGLLKLIREIKGLFRDGTFRAEIARSFSLDQAAEALTAADAPGKPGKTQFKIA